MAIAIYVISFILAAAGFLYGACYLLRGKTPLYFKLIVSSTGCCAFERLSALVNYLTEGPYYITLGELGIFGALLFLLSSNYGAMDHIVDDGVGTGKYRAIALAAPIASILSLVYVFLRALPLGAGTAGIIVFILFPIIPASYFSFKHLILPKDALGFLRALRGCHFCSLLYYLSLIISAFALIKGGVWGSLLSVLPALFSALISVFAVRGDKLWII